jgi:hypothetical protein
MNRFELVVSKKRPHEGVKLVIVRVQVLLEVVQTSAHVLRRGRNKPGWPPDLILDRSELAGSLVRAANAVHKHGM